MNHVSSKFTSVWRFGSAWKGWLVFMLVLSFIKRPYPRHQDNCFVIEASSMDTTILTIPMATLVVFLRQSGPRPPLDLLTTRHWEAATVVSNT